MHHPTPGGETVAFTSYFFVLFCRDDGFTLPKHRLYPDSGIRRLECNPQLPGSPIRADEFFAAAS
ncbi:MAG: hypothetical protein QOG55_3256 [Acidobacteriaceae bacterium]|jgi:hypothetical protein|nr:hypothetical protein [Acidobacteriaceae bacterium]